MIESFTNVIFPFLGRFVGVLTSIGSATYDKAVAIFSGGYCPIVNTFTGLAEEVQITFVTADMIQQTDGVLSAVIAFVSVVKYLINPAQIIYLVTPHNVPFVFALMWFIFLACLIGIIIKFVVHFFVG